MAIHLHDRKPTAQRLFGSFESKLFKICIGAPFLAARHHHQRKAFSGIASHLFGKTTSIHSRCSRAYCSSSVKSNPPKNGFLEWYLSKLHSNPLITKGVSTSIIFSVADITAQYITLPPNGSIDGIRMLRMSSYGLLIMGPAQHCWFNFLSKIMPRTSLSTTLTKIVMGQAIFGPCINSVFFSYNAALRGENQQEIKARLKRDLIPTLKSGLIYWPLCDFLTFSFVPVHLQPLANSSFAYLWTIYLTYMASLTKVEEPEIDAQLL